MKILFSVVVLKGIGGIESSLLNLLNNLNGSEYDIDLCVIGNYISEVTQIPEHINIIKGNKIIEYSCTEYSDLKKYLNRYQLVCAAIIKIIKKLVGYRKILKFCLPFMKIRGEYDVAISYSNDKYLGVYTGGCDDFIKECVTAKRKIAWIHNDARQHGLTHSICIRKYQAFDYIVNVSQGCKKIFDEIVPEYEYKSKVVTNMLDLNKIRLKKSERSPYHNDYFNIVTVARIENRQKRIDRVIEACEMLKESGVKNFRWTIVGDGEDLRTLIECAQSKHLLDCISFVGRKPNTIPYMQHADLFVQTSDYEAYSMVLIEALSVGCPCVVTNYDSAENIITNGENGWIVDRDAGAIFERVSEIINQPKMLQGIREKCVKSCKNLNLKAINSFRELLGADNETTDCNNHRW